MISLFVSLPEPSLLNKNSLKYLLIGAFISIFILFSSNALSSYSLTDVQVFRNSLSDIVNKSKNLTMSFQEKVPALNVESSNSSRIEMIDLFLPNFETLLKNATNIDYPSDLKSVRDALVNSLKFETDSYRHYRSYLISGNRTEDSISTDLLTKAFQNEQIYAKFLASQ